MTDATEKLLPDSLVSALQTLVSVATISLITFGDRTLNAALAALATVLFSLSMERIQKYKSWSHLWEVYSPRIFLLSLSSFSSFSLSSLFTRKMELKGKGSTDFNPLHVPTISPDTVFKHCIIFDQQNSRRRLNLWGCKKFGSHVYLKLPEKMFANYSINSKLSINECPMYDGTVWHNGYFPIWRSADGSFVYVTSKEFFKGDGDYRCRIVGNNKKDLEDVVQAINKHAEENEREDRSKSLSIYKFDTNGLSTKHGTLSIHKTFDHLFFDQKKELIEALTRFRDGNMYAKHLGEDNKLGILLYGPPGTGKSACMAAICNFLKRTPALVTGSQLLKRSIMDIVFQNSIDVIIMDEFDCLLDVIRKRNGIMGGSEEGGGGGGVGGGDNQEHYGSQRNYKYQMASGYLQMAKDEKDDAKKKELMKKYEDCLNEDDKVDMAYILSKFQGMEAADNRCIVACTNDPSRIDDALKRKGRFDIIIHLDYASPSIIFDMVAHYFLLTPGEKMALSEEFLGSLPMKVIAPATVQDINASSRSARESLSRIATMKPLSCLMAPNSSRQSVSSSGSTGEPI